MRLAYLDINGFKSFADKTRLEFADGTTAIVGPNGCGKSNISDSLAWVLGETSAKSLRGQRMEDVLFNGTAKRKPIGLCHVTLALRTEAGDLVRISRRMDREGISEYQLDGKVVRRKDVQDFLAGSGLAVRAYSHIEQGKIDQVLSAKPQNRRALFEEAANISRYRMHRKAAQSKLDSTQANLLRLTDVVQELEKQHRSLARQAGKARRVEQDKKDLLVLQRSLFYQRGEEINQQSEELKTELDTNKEAMAQAMARVAEAESNLTSLQVKVEEVRERRNEHEDQLHDLDLRIQQLEGQQNLSTERILTSKSQKQTVASELGPIPQRLEDVGGVIVGLQSKLDEHESHNPQARVDETRKQVELVETNLNEVNLALRQGREKLFKLAEETAQFNNRLTGVDTRLAGLDEDQTQVNQERQDLNGQLEVLKEKIDLAEATKKQTGEHLESAEQALAQASQSRQQAEQALAQTRQADRQKHSEYLSALHRKESWQEAIERQKSQSGTHEMLTQAGLPKTPLSDQIQVKDSQDIPLVERALEPLLDTFLVQGQDLTNLLSKARGGGANLFAADRALPVEKTPTPAGTRALQDLVDMPAEYASALPQVFFDPGESLPQAWGQTSAILINKHGDVFHPDGRVQLAAEDASQGPLRARRQLEEFEQALAQVSQAKEISTKALQQAEQTHMQSRKTLEESREFRDTKRGQARDAQAQFNLAKHQADPINLRLQVLNGQQEKADQDRQTQLTLKNELEEKIQGSTESQKTTEGQIPQLEEKGSGLQEDLISQREVMGKARFDLDRFQEQKQILDNQMRDQVGRRKDLTSHQEQLSGKLTDLEGVIEREGKAHKEREHALAESLRERDVLTDQRHKDDEEFDGLNEEHKTLELDTKQSRENAAALQEMAKESEVAWASLRERARGLEEMCSEELSMDLRTLLEQEDPRPEDFKADQADGERLRLKKRLESAGPVNFVAAQEAEEVAERLNFLREQTTDVGNAAEELRATIRKLDLTSKEKFLEAFAAVSVHFTEIFTRVFAGGEAYLRLEDPADPLNCGIDIFVQPPGKKLQSISLLSGGERAMTAVALLFAIFRHHPSPFCILDEVDAPLDEANTRRFVALMETFKSHTQFITITHNRYTMEQADYLYGVTMEEPGISTILSVRLEEIQQEELPVMAGEED